MKIEKINDNQIRCILNSQDLQERQLKLSEFAYGSGKAKELFHDMMEKASEEYDFEVDNAPLMIEAIPTSAESLILIITKVDNPDELDTRFSTFTPYEDKSSEEDEDMSGNDTETAPPELDQFNNQVLDLIKKKLHELSEKVEEKAVSSPAPVFTKARVFRFRSFEHLTAFAKSVSGFFHGMCELYRDEKEHAYYLCIFLEGSTADEFNRICNIACEYAAMLPKTNLHYFTEHCTSVMDSNVLEQLAEF